MPAGRNAPLYRVAAQRTYILATRHAHTRSRPARPLVRMEASTTVWLQSKIAHASATDHTGKPVDEGLSQMLLEVQHTLLLQVSPTPRPAEPPPAAHDAGSRPAA